MIIQSKYFFYVNNSLFFGQAFGFLTSQKLENHLWSQVASRSNEHQGNLVLQEVFSTDRGEKVNIEIPEFGNKTGILYHKYNKIFKTKQGLSLHMNFIILSMESMPTYHLIILLIKKDTTCVSTTTVFS